MTLNHVNLEVTFEILHNSLNQKDFLQCSKIEVVTGAI